MLGSDKVALLSQEVLGLSGSFCQSSCPHLMLGAAARSVLVTLVGAGLGVATMSVNPASLSALPADQRGLPG